MDERRYRDLFGRLDHASHPAPDGRIWLWRLLSRLARNGIVPGDPRVQQAMSRTGVVAAPDQPPATLSFEEFCAVAGPPGGVLERALRDDLAVGGFPRLTADLGALYDEVAPIASGKPAGYTYRRPDADIDELVIAFCSVDGQQIVFGKSDESFPLQSVTKPWNYAIALDEHGADAVHRFVGQEQNGGRYNRLALNDDGLPHNPMINAGAMAAARLIAQNQDKGQRIAHVMQVWDRMMPHRAGFAAPNAASESNADGRNRALANEMWRSGALPADLTREQTDQVFDFYVQTCAIEVTAPGLAAAGATMAGGGVSAFTGERVFSPETVQKTLSSMSSSGMYDYSGEFLSEVGLPAKSGVSGAVVLVVPEVGGFCAFSPRLDERGNSVRGLEFCRRLAATYDVHPYGGLGQGADAKRDLRGRPTGHAADPALGRTAARAPNLAPDLPSHGAAAMHSRRQGSAADPHQTRIW